MCFQAARSIATSEVGKRVVHPWAKKKEGIRPPEGNASNCFLQLTGFKLSVTVILAVLFTAAVTVVVVLGKVFVISLRNVWYNIARTIATGARYCRILPREGMVVTCFCGGRSSL
jgi:hypothetical protein